MRIEFISDILSSSYVLALSRYLHSKTHLSLSLKMKIFTSDPYDAKIALSPSTVEKSLNVYLYACSENLISCIGTVGIASSG